MPKKKSLVTKTNLDQVFREIKEFMTEDEVMNELARMMDPAYIRIRIMEIASRRPVDLGESELREVVQLATIGILQKKEEYGTLKTSKRKASE